MHDGDTVRDVPDDREVVGDKQVRDLELHLQVLEQVYDACLDRDVQGGDGLVEQQDLGACGQGAGDGNALALASRELGRKAVDVVGIDAHEVHQLADAAVDVLGRHPLCPHRLGEHVVDGHAWIERAHGILEDDLHVTPERATLAVVPERGDVRAKNRDAAALRLHEVHDLHERRRLARTGLADQGKRLALVDRERGVVDGGHGAPVPAYQALALYGEGLHEVLDLKHDGPLVAGHLRPLGGQGLECGVDLLEAEMPLAYRVKPVTAHEMTLSCVKGLEERLCLVADVDGHRAAGREGAARRDGSERGRVAPDGYKAMLRSYVRFGHGAEEAHRIGMRGTLKERVDARALHGPAGVHDHNVIDGSCDDAKVVCDEHDGCARLLLGDGKNVQYLGLDCHVKRGRRLVRDDDIGVVRDGDGDDHTLAHATRELMRVGIKALLGFRDADRAK